MKKIKSIPHRFRKGAHILKHEGALPLGIKVLTKLQERKIKNTDNPQLKRKFISLVGRDQVMQADWSNLKKDVKTTHTKPYTINWIMSPPSGGGGHQNIFRFIEFLDKQGCTNNVYIYSTFDDMTLAQAKENVKAYCHATKLHFYRHGTREIKGDILFATGWETAYPVFNEKTNARKMYFVQDFEPHFYPVGTDYVLAENTYKFGFYGITAGGWLSKKLSAEYGMETDSYDFGAEKSLYNYKNSEPRKKVFFYARPVTERRGFDLGVMVLELFHRARPDYEIILAGWDVSDYDISFPYQNLKALPIHELGEVYNQCAVALVLSLTNMSLLPLELLACGTIPVVNDGPNNRQVSDNKYIEYSKPSPQALADAMVKIVDTPGLEGYARKASESVSDANWQNAGEKFMKIIDKVMS